MICEYAKVFDVQKQKHHFWTTCCATNECQVKDYHLFYVSNFHSIQSIKKRKKAFHLNSSKSINLESIDKWPIAPDVFRSVDKSNGAQTRHYLYLAMPLACKSDSIIKKRAILCLIFLPHSCHESRAQHNAILHTQSTHCAHKSVSSSWCPQSRFSNKHKQQNGTELCAKHTCWTRYLWHLSVLQEQSLHHRVYHTFRWVWVFLFTSPTSICEQ